MSDVTLINHFEGKLATAILHHSIHEHTHLIGKVTEVVAQGVTMIWGRNDELTTFLPWTNIRSLTHTAPLMPQTSGSSVESTASIVGTV